MTKIKKLQYLKLKMSTIQFLQFFKDCPYKTLEWTQSQLDMSFNFYDWLMSFGGKN